MFRHLFSIAGRRSALTLRTNRFIKPGLHMNSTDVNIDILSFDGGGSRGIMEVSLLNDVMRMATIVLNHPKTVQSYLCSTENNVLEDFEIRKRLIIDLKNVSKPLHPTEVYDMIVGTSTGALIAFGLVGGKETEDGKRVLISTEECIEMYLQKTKTIFTKSWLHWFLSGLQRFFSIPLKTYSQDNVKKVLLQQFGDSCLGDFYYKKSMCVAGAVARKLGSNEELVLFDTKSEDYKLYKTHQVLLATSNAPFYFDTPVRIGNDEFVDGGVGGNCPLMQAIPRAKDIFCYGVKDVNITSALSIAPPNPPKLHAPRGFETKFWLNYFVHQSTDGYAVYRDAVKRNKKTKTLFQRLSPRGEALKSFKLDDVDAQKMLNAMENEKLNNEMFLIDIVSTAMVVVYISVDKLLTSEVDQTSIRVAAQLAETAGNVYSRKKEYESAVVSYQTSIRLWKKYSNKDKNDLTISNIYHQIANCFKEQGAYQRAIELYSSNLEYLNANKNESNRDIIINSLLQLAACFVSCFRYKEAEKYYSEVLCSDVDTKLLSRILRDLAWSVHQQGRLDEAVCQYFKATKITKTEGSVRAEALNNLGLCLLDLGMNKRAQGFIEEALAMHKSLSKKNNDRHVSDSLINLGLCLMENGDYDGAEKNLNQALEMIKKCNNGNEMDVAFAISILAKCRALKNGDQPRAMAYVQQALTAMKKCIGDVENPGIAQTLAIAGLCFLRAGRYDEAMEYFKKAERMTLTLFGSSHPSLEKIYRYLSELYYKHGKKDSKEKCYNEKAKKVADKIAKMREKVEKLPEISSNIK